MNEQCASRMDGDEGCMLTDDEASDHECMMADGHYGDHLCECGVLWKQRGGLR